MFTLTCILGPPHSPTNLMQETVVSQGTHLNNSMIRISWNLVDTADNYIISISPSVESGSTFTTSNTSIQLPLIYNTVYNISVVASNCAGNSTPTYITITTGIHTLYSYFCAIRNTHSYYTLYNIIVIQAIKLFK